MARESALLMTTEADSLRRRDPVEPADDNAAADQRLVGEIATLKDWYLARRYDEPDLDEPALVGIVAGHRRKKDGSLIRTGRIVEVHHRLVRTYSTVYWLGRPWMSSTTRWFARSGSLRLMRPAMEFRSSRDSSSNPCRST
jgi:hypothetical protein